MKRLALIFGMTTVFLAQATVDSPAVWAGSETATVEFGTLESVAWASNGDSIEVSGAGSFSLQPKSVSGDAPLIEAEFGSVPRTFTHRDAGLTSWPKGRGTL